MLCLHQPLPNRPAAWLMLVMTSGAVKPARLPAPAATVVTFMHRMCCGSPALSSKHKATTLGQHKVGGYGCSLCISVILIGVCKEHISHLGGSTQESDINQLIACLTSGVLYVEAHGSLHDNSSPSSNSSDCNEQRAGAWWNRTVLLGLDVPHSVCSSGAVQCRWHVCLLPM